MSVEINAAAPVVVVDANPPIAAAKVSNIATIRNPIEREPYEGAYVVNPSYDNDIVLATDGLRMTDDVTVQRMIWNWIGKDAEKIASYAKTTTALKDTTFNTWTPSTTAKAIKSASTAGTFTADMATYEYFIRWRFRCDVATNTGATLQYQIYREVAEIWQVLTRRAGSIANINARATPTNSCVTLYTAPLEVYYGATAGSLTYTHSVSYGIYPSATAATFSSSSANTPTVTVKTPAVNARCHNTYFATARAAEVDKANSVFYLLGEVYRVKKNSAMQEMSNDLYDIYNNGV